MDCTIEHALEILAGVVPRAININIARTDQSIIRSLGNQVKKSVGLTDRQLALSIKKIEQYRGGLEANSIDVNGLLELKTLRNPLRIIDRRQSISLDTSGKETFIVVQFPFSKKLGATWDSIATHLVGDIVSTKNTRAVKFNEKSLLLILSAFEPLGFIVSEDIRELQTAIEVILDNQNNYIPHVAVDAGQLVLKNVTKSCQEYFDSKFSDRTGKNIFRFLNSAKSCGIDVQNQEVTSVVSANFPNSPLNSLVMCNDTRFRIKPNKYDMDFLFGAIDDLGQWPVLVVLEDETSAYKKVKECYEVLTKYVRNEEMTVFFRLDNGQPDHKEFNQFIKDNTLNNYIDSKTKVVFITKTRIPKPLYKADWHPNTAVVFPIHDFGKMSAYLNDFATVYYYNESVSIRHNRIKGTREIVEL